MKTIKGNALGIFVFFSVLFGSCFNPPEFSVFPTIKPPETGKFVDFKPGLNTDSLIVFFDFEDGDGDLGLGPTQTDDPYHPVFYYLAHEGDTTPLSTALKYSNLPPFVVVPPGAQGQLVTYKTRDEQYYQDNFPDLFPPYQCPESGINYSYDSVFVDEANKHIFDERVTLDHVKNNGVDKVYVLLDTFYVRPNPNHYNVEVQFYVKNNDGSFDLFDWKREFCVPQDFSQRFPVLTDNSNPLAGTLKYAMTSIGFRLQFSGRYLKLKVRIRDRALHTSNWLETEEIFIQ